MVIERGTPAVSEDTLSVTAPVVVDLQNTPSAVAEVIATIPPSPTATPPPTRVATSTPLPTATTIPTPLPTPTPTVVPTATERPVPADVEGPYSEVVMRGDSGRQEVAFTFDAGAGRGYTAEILDLLLDMNVVGTFGITGVWAESNPDLVDRMVSEGHQIINHTWDHSSFTGASNGAVPLTVEERTDQIELTEQMLNELTDGYTSKPFFRFPYGDYDIDALELTQELGYGYTVWWTCDTLAWNDYSAEEIVQRCGVTSELGGPGAIILMHVAQDGDWAALEPLLRDYLDSGYRLVTIEQMLQP